MTLDDVYNLTDAKLCCSTTGLKTLDQVCDSRQSVSNALMVRYLIRTVSF